MPLKLGKDVLYPARALMALALGLAGAAAATLLGLPLPILLGSMATVALVAILDLKPFGITPALPQGIRQGFIPIIGVSIGGAFAPSLLTEAQQWWPTLLALLVYIPLAHWMGFVIYHRLGRLDRPTALFAAVPGGLIESIAMGEQAGADIAMLTMLQFMRLIFCIVLVPLGFAILTGELVGSAGGAVMTGANNPIHLWDVLVMLAAGLAGALLGTRIGLPGAVITGPLLLSGLAHLTGLIQTVPPQWLIQLTQLIVGTSLGIRFFGLPPGAFRRALALSLTVVCGTLGLAFICALLLHGTVGQSNAAVFIALAPGGVAEMSLVALSLHISVIYVTSHHVARIVLAVGVAQIIAKRLL